MLASSTQAQLQSIDTQFTLRHCKLFLMWIYKVGSQGNRMLTCSIELAMKVSRIAPNGPNLPLAGLNTSTAIHVLIYSNRAVSDRFH